MGEITHEQLLEILDYDKDTGYFYWKKKIRRAVVGARAGSIKPNSDGCIRVKVLGREYLAHRLAWFYVNGEWPKLDICHINGNNSDNRVENLRAGTRKELSSECPAQELTHSHLLEILNYDKDTGRFTWRKRLSRNVVVGSNAGMVKTQPGKYLKIEIYGKTYNKHRLAWFYVYGEWPKHQIDHINHDRTDNRIANLRDVCVRENARNRSKSDFCSSGVYGVTWNKSDRRWKAQIRVDGELLYLGYFKDFDAAIAARQAANIVHGFHENHGKDLIAA